MEAGERSKAEARKRQQREECWRLAEKARQEALMHTHKLPRKLWDGKKDKDNRLFNQAKAARERGIRTFLQG